MNGQHTPFDPEKASSRPLARQRVLGPILFVASPIVIFAVIGNLVGLATFAGGALINLGYVLAIVAGGIVLQREGSSWRVIGLAKPQSWAKTILYGFGAWIGAVIVFVLAQGVAIGLLTMLDLVPPGIDESRFNPVQGNLPLFVLMLVLAWTTIAFGEELFYRAFLISRLVDHTALGGRSAVVISAVVFGAVHFAEGPIGIFSNAAFGALFGWIYLKSGRNLWITLVGHGLLNTFRFTLLFLGAV